MQCLSLLLFTLANVATTAAPVVQDLFGADSSSGGWRGPALITTNTSVLIFGTGPLANGTKVSALRRSIDNGATWSAAEVLPFIGPQPLYDPTTNTVIVLFKRVPRGSPRQCSVFCGRWVSNSTDDGRTWSTPVPAAEGNTTWGNGLASGIALKYGKAKGNLLAAYRTDCADPAGGLPADWGGGFPANCTEAAWRPADGNAPNPVPDRALISTDRGATWHAGGVTPPHMNGHSNAGWTECQVAELANGSVVLTSRTIQPLGRVTTVVPYQRLFAMSHDGGESWSKSWGFKANQAYNEGYGPEYNTEGSIISARQGQKLLLSKVTASQFPGNHNGYRRNLTVAESDDGGASWAVRPWGLVYAHLAAYSDMTVLPNGKIGVAFERGTTQEYRFVSFAVVSPPW